ncbi:GldG family protein [Coraliomargarita sp. SDUM461004]|uniref:GldG family protein n=1 Tax=Thalassobacterium sedimentorum TaxID=3041258 RepID=A0ABU1AGP8_9BACT|nr:GldG family protein [Coraliomargarita sp. SDUM461004]MDQ8193904.1 GldG family protein [Coraliomargarita sp. SDUM461004]
MQINRFNEFRVARRFRVINRSVQIILGLCLIASLNYLAAKYFERIDLTQSGSYTLAPESKAYIRELEEPVDIIVTIPNDPEIAELQQIHQHLQKLFREYEAAGMHNGKAYINIEFVDIYRQRKRAQELTNKYNLTQENVILVAMGERTREIRQADLYEVENNQIAGFRGEKAITSAIIDVSSKDEDKIYFLVGHGEMRLDDVDPLRGLSQLEAFLRERNYGLATLDLAVDENVPDDANLIVVPSPQASLLPEEVEKLRRYMNERNGRMIVLIDPGRRHGMEELFYDWGVLADDMVVVDVGPDYRSQGGDLIIRRFAEHPITNLLVDYQITALFGQPRPMRTDPGSLKDPRLKVTQIIGTSDQSWGERDYRSQDPLKYDAGRDLKGPITIATVSSRTAGTELGINIPGGRFVAFGNSDFITNNRLRAFGNRTLFFNSMNWALSRNSLLNIATRPLESYQVVMSERDLNRILIYFAILPGATALLGLLIYLIRRR